MPMTLRARLEAVLRKHHDLEPVSGHAASGHTGSHQCSLCETTEQLLTDLLACLPTPSREGLEAIIHNWEIDVAGIRNWTSVEELHMQATWRREALTESLMAWATGQAAPTWCENITWNRLGHSWQYQVADSHGVFVNVCAADHWKCCPVCAAPRPT